jgi:hypothetical protein
MSHLCGLCLTLRDLHGHAARAVTNVDGLLVSVLVEAQAPRAARRRRAGPCALRAMRPATVMAADDPGARLAAAVSLVLAAGKTRDHVEDGDGMFGRDWWPRPPAASPSAGSRAANGPGVTSASTRTCWSWHWSGRPVLRRAPVPVRPS